MSIRNNKRANLNLTNSFRNYTYKNNKKKIEISTLDLILDKKYSCS